MKIHFCDLCNESVPQGDLDLGRAALVKGRVVCQKCNELMADRASRAAAPAGGSPAAGAVAGMFAMAPAQHHAQGGHTFAARQRSSGVGTALALIAWIGIAGVGFWLFDRSEQEKRHIERRFDDLRTETVDLRARLESARNQLDAQRVEDARTVGERLAEQRSQVSQALEAQGVQARDVEARLSGFDQRLASLQQSLGGVQRHDKELLALQQKFSSLSDELSDLGRVMGDLVEQSARAARAPVQAQAPSEPAWTGLVAALSSPDDGDRWQAVIALGETRDPAVAEHIVPVLKDSDIFVRMAAARILGDLGAPVGIPALIDALSDPEPSVREAVYSALKSVTKRDFPFDALSENAEERQKRIKAWRDWWEKEKPQAGG